MANALQKINKRVKHLQRLHPGKKRVTLQKQAGAEYRAGKLGRVKKKSVHKKKTHHKKKSAGSHRVGATNVGTDRVDRKRVSINVGGITKAQAKSHIVNQTKEQLAWALLQRDTAKNKTARRKLSKRVSALKSELHRYR